MAKIGITARKEMREYNLAGELDTVTDMEGQVTRYTYDALGRVDLVEYFVAGANLATNPADQSVDYTYRTFGVFDLLYDGTSTPVAGWQDTVPPEKDFRGTGDGPVEGEDEPSDGR